MHVLWFPTDLFHTTPTLACSTTALLYRFDTLIAQARTICWLGFTRALHECSQRTFQSATVLLVILHLKFFPKRLTISNYYPNPNTDIVKAIMHVLHKLIAGYLTLSNVDINECLPNGGLGPCAQNCTNTIGSFQCSCQPGYTQSGYTCNGENEETWQHVWLQCAITTIKITDYIIQRWLCNTLTLVWIVFVFKYLIIVSHV